MSEVLSYQEFMEALDSVNSKAVKKKFKDRKDKDIDNDGDVDSSDKFLHKRRKAISKAVKNEDMEKPMTSAERAKMMQKKADKVKRDAEAKLKKAKGITMGEGKYAKYSDLLLKKQRMKKMGQNTMVVDKEIEAEKKKVQSDKSGTMSMKKEMAEAKDTHKTKDGGTAKKGLYYNINKKKKSGAKMRKKGDEGSPTEKDFDNAAKTAKEEVDPIDLRGRPKKADSHPNSPYGVKHPLHPANVAKRKERERKKAQSANEERELCHSKDHDCATVVEHPVWGLGKPMYESHAVPTDDGYVSWYDVEFDHGIEKEVPTEERKVYTTEDHSKYMKPKSKKAVNDEMYASKKKDKNKMIDEEEYSEADIKKAVELAKRMAGSNYTGATNAINKMKKGLASVGKVKYALRKAAESFETFNGLSISEVNDIVDELASSAQDYIKLVESGDLESAVEPDVELAKGMPLSFKQFKSKIGE